MDLFAAVKTHNWYLIAAFLQMAFIQLVRKHPLSSAWWQKIPSGWRFLPGVVLSFAVGFVAAYRQNATFGAAALEGGLAILGIGLPAAGAAAWLKESPLPWDGGSGGAAAALLIFLVLPTTTSCQNPKTAADVEHAAYNASVVALEVLDDAETAHMQALEARTPPPTPADLAHETDAVARLDRARDLLSVAHDALVKSDGASAETAIRDAGKLLIDAIAEAKADGIPVSASVEASVESGLGLIGAGP